MQALLELLGTVMPTGFRQAVAAEQTLYDEEGARWEPVSPHPRCVCGHDQAAQYACTQCDCRPWARLLPAHL